MLISNGKMTFGIAIDPANLHIVRLRTCWLADALTYPFMTLLLQAVGMAIVGIEAAFRVNDEVIVDTVGCVFAYPSWRLLLRSYVVAYIHYPFIVRDAAVSSIIKKNGLILKLRVVYYKTLSYASGIAYSAAHCLLANSTCTADHIRAITSNSTRGQVNRVTVLYPPCNTEELESISITEARSPIIVSIAQFRPEKRHALLLEIFASLLEKLRGYAGLKHTKLVLIGGVRNRADIERVDSLQGLAHVLGISKHVEFVVNAPYTTVKSILSTASIGLHTMIDEHFGIGIVEYMAAGVIPVAHRSGGPLKDIVADSKCGYLCSTPAEYIGCLKSTLSKLPHADDMRRIARKRAVSLFSDSAFEIGIEKVLYQAKLRGCSRSKNCKL